MNNFTLIGTDETNKAMVAERLEAAAAWFTERHLACEANGGEPITAITLCETMNAFWDIRDVIAADREGFVDFAWDMCG